MQREPRRPFPLLAEYSGWEINGEIETVYTFEAGDPLLKEADREMQDIIDEEAAELKKQIKRDQQELLQMSRTSSDRDSRLRAALRRRIREGQSKLSRLDSRARRLGLMVSGGNGSEFMRSRPNMIEKAVKPALPSDQGSLQGLGVVAEGGLGLMKDGRLIVQLSGREWVEAVQARLLGGQIWFQKRGRDWFPTLALDWQGMVQRDPIQKFVIWPWPEGAAAEGEPVVSERGANFSRFSLSRLLAIPGDRFRCQIELDGGTGEVLQRGFDFQVKREDGQVVPVLLESDSLSVEAQLRGRETKVPNAKFLKEIKTGGQIVQAISYDQGSRILIRVEDPARVRVLDTDGMKWVKEWDLPGDKAVTTSNGDSLFVFDPETRLLKRHLLEGLTTAAELAVAGEEELLAMGIGTEAKDAPLLLVYRTRLELRDPQTLAVRERVLADATYRRVKNPKAAETKFPDFSGTWVVHADPLGKAFSVNYFGKNETRNVEHTILVHEESGIWYQRISSLNQMVLRGGLLGQAYQIRWIGSEIPVVRPRDMDRSVGLAYHTAGRGLMGLKIELGREVFPNPPMLVSYRPTPSVQSVDLCFGGQVAVKNFERRGSSRHPAMTRFQPFFLLPSRGRLVSLGRDRVVFEEYPENALPGEMVVEATHQAIRGQSYRYLPKTRNGETPEFKIAKGPAGLTFTKGKGFQWEVPPNLQDDQVDLQVIRVGKTVEEYFAIPVVGKIGTGLVDLTNPGKVQAVLPVTCDPFAEPIDDVQAAVGKDLLLVTSSYSRQLRVIDLESGGTVSELDSPGGPFKVYPIPGGVLLCYLDGMILEKRSLPGLERTATTISEGEGRLISLIVGRAENAGSPFALFEKSEQDFFIRELNLESLHFGPEVALPKFRQNQSRQKRGAGWLTEPAVSADGRKAWFGGDLLKQEEPGKYSYNRIINRLFSENGVLTDSYGQSVFKGGQRYQAGSLKPSRPGGGNPVLLVPDQGGDWLMSLHSSGNTSRKGAGGQWIDLIPMQKSEARFRLEGLNEFNVDPGHLATSQENGPPRMMLYGSSPFLVTVSMSDRELLIRKLSLDQK